MYFMNKTGPDDVSKANTVGAGKAEMALSSELKTIKVKSGIAGAADIRAD